MLGTTAELIYVLYFLRRFPLLRYYGGLTDLGAFMDLSRGDVVFFPAAVTVLFGLVALAWWWLHRPESGCSDRNREDKGTLWLILGFGAVFALTMVFVYPITSHDIYPYIDQSLILVHYHANPFFTTPAAYPGDPLMPLSNIWINTAATYGPFGIVLDALPTFAVGRNLLANLVLLKLMFSAMILADGVLIYRILRRLAPQHALTGVLLFVWNPFVLIEFSANAHNDIAVILFILLAMLSLVENELVFAVVLIVASALVKYATIALIPLLLVYGIARQPTLRKRVSYAALATGGSLALVAFAYAPFWEGFATLRAAYQLQSQSYFMSFASTLTWMFPGHVSTDQATAVGRVLFAPLYAYALWLSTRGPLELMRGCFIALFGFLAVALGNVWFWYVVWPLILALVTPSLTRRLAALALAYASELAAVLYFYASTGPGARTISTLQLGAAAYAITFVPATIVLGWSVARQHQQSRRRDADLSRLPPHPTSP